jgi:hypothetical protein
VFFLFLDPLENVVLSRRAARKEAVYRILLIRKDFEHCIQLCQRIQTQVLDIEAGKPHRATVSPNLSVTEDQCLKSIGVDSGYFREVENDIHSVGFHKRVYRGTESCFRVARFQVASQIENLNSLFFAMIETQIHRRPAEHSIRPF